MSSQITAELPRKSWKQGEIIEWLMASDAVCESARRPYIEFFLQCLRFWAGDQWRDIVETVTGRFDTRLIRPIGTADWRLVDNQVAIYLRDAVARAAANWPRLECLPQDVSEPLDVFAAQIGTRFLDWRHRKDKEEWLREMEWLWMLGTGECLRQTIYDAEGGDPMVGEGDIATLVVDPFRYSKDPQSVMEWPPRFLIVREARHVDWIKENLGVTVEPENVAEVQQYYDSLAMNVIAAGQRGDRESLPKAAIVWQRFIPPGKLYPQGWYYARVGTKLVRSNPLQAGQWPFAKGGWMPIPGRMYQMGLIEMLMNDQRQLNALVSLLYEGASKAVRGDLTVVGPITNARAIRPQVYDAKTGAKITILPYQTQVFPTEHGVDWTQGEVQRQRIDRNLHEKAATNQPSLGQPLEKTETLGAQVMSREGDSVVSAWHLRRYATQHLTEIATQKLSLAKEFYALPRRLEGLGGTDNIGSFEGADLRDTQQVIAVAVPNLTPAEKQKASMEAFGAGLRGPWLDPQGMPSLAMQYAARSTLRDVGLDEVEEGLAKTYGSYEGLEEKVKALAAMWAQAELLKAEMMLELTISPPPMAPPGGAPGQPPPAGQPVAAGGQFGA